MSGKDAFAVKIIFPLKREVAVTRGKEDIKMKRRTPYIVWLLLLLTIFAAGQANTAAGLATVKGHTLGESVASFAKVIGYNLDACPQVLTLTAKDAKKQKLNDIYSTCKAFSTAEKGLSLIVESFAIQMGDRNRPDVIIAKNIIDGAHSELHFSNSTNTDISSIYLGIAMDWAAVIEDRKLVEFRIALDSSKYSFADIAAELLQKYGEPTTKRVVSYQNGFGAKFDTGLWSWKLSDGSTIIADEVFGYSNTRMVVVSYFIAGRFEKVTNSRKASNALD
jgi:hypothetical protein